MYNYEPHKRWEKGCSCHQLSAKFLGISTIFQHMPNQFLLHTQCWIGVFFIVSRLSKSLFSGIFKSWSDHHNTLYFYVHILYQIVGFIHYKDGINKRRWIKRSFIVEIVLNLASALKSHSPTKNTLNSCLCAATNFIIGHLVLIQPVFHKSTKTLSQQNCTKTLSEQNCKKELTLLCCKSDIPWPLTIYPVFFKKQNLVGWVIERVIHLTILSYSHSALNN